MGLLSIRGGDEGKYAAIKAAVMGDVHERAIILSIQLPAITLCPLISVIALTCSYSVAMTAVT